MSDNKDSPKPVLVYPQLLMYENRLYVNAQEIWYLLGPDGVLSRADADTQDILDHGIQTLATEQFWATMTASRGV